MHIYYTKKAAASILAIFFCFVLPALVVTFANVYRTSPLFGKTAGIAENTVIIDPGHGSPDGGAVGVDGVIEKDINLSISFKLKSLFQATGYTVIMTRENDNAIYDEGSKTIRKKKATDLHNRLAIVNSHSNAVFISIHQNIYKSSKNSGSVVFYSPNNDNSKVLAQSIQDSIAVMLQPQNTRAVNPAKRNLYILYNAKSPAVMVECGFLSNPAECKLLQDDDYQNKMAFAIFSGTLNFYAS